MPTMEQPRIEEYDKDGIREVLEVEGLGLDDLLYLSAFDVEATQFIEMPDGHHHAWAGTKSVAVIDAVESPSGIYKPVGGYPIIVLNRERDVIDYDMVSELHPLHDASVYALLTAPYEKPDEGFIYLADWYRRDVYKDGIKPWTGDKDDTNH